MIETTPYSEGDPNSKLIIVAEAPAREEMVRCRPLVGPTGRLFNDLLSEAGGVRSRIHIVNVSREPISNISKYVGNNNKLTKAGEVLAKDLQNRLSKTHPNTIVAMGKLALTALVGDGRISKLRGSPLESTLLPGTEVIPCLHPAMCLPFRRQTHMKYTIVADLRKALRHADMPGVIRPNRTLLVEPTFSEVMAFLSHIEQYHTVALDIEVYNHQVSCISFSVDPMVSMSIPFAQDYWTEGQEAQIWLRIAHILSNPAIRKCGQYVTFDISFLLLQNGIHTHGDILDTYCAHRIMYPDFPASLEFITSLYTDEPYYKDDRKLWNRLDKDIHRFWRYNATDSAVVLEDWQAIEPDLWTHPGFIRTYRMTMDVVEPCLYLMSRGIRIDTERLQETKERIRQELAAKQAELKETLGFTLNPDSPKQCTAHFYGTRGIKPYISRKTGNPTCDDKALARIVRRYNLPEARLIQEIRSLNKLLSTYLDLRYDNDRRLRCFYNPRGTTTGRLSSSKTVRETGLNMQNLHPAFLEFLVPDYCPKFGQP